MTMPDRRPDELPELRARPYAITGGRTRPAADLPIETIVRTTDAAADRLGRLRYERRSIVLLCTRPLALAEVAARLRLPLGVVRVLAGDLVAEGVLRAHLAPSTAAGLRPDVRLLERVLDGLHAL